MDTLFQDIWILILVGSNSSSFSAHFHTYAHLSFREISQTFSVSYTVFNINQLLFTYVLDPFLLFYKIPKIMQTYWLLKIQILLCLETNSSTLTSSPPVLSSWGDFFSPLERKDQCFNVLWAWVWVHFQYFKCCSDLSREHMFSRNTCRSKDAKKTTVAFKENYSN